MKPIVWFARRGSAVTIAALVASALVLVLPIHREPSPVRIATSTPPPPPPPTPPPEPPPPPPGTPCEPAGRSHDGAVLNRYIVSDGCTAEGREDLDGDGAVDCWSATYGGGSGFGGFVATVDPGCRGAALTIDESSSFAEMLAAIPVPAEATPAHVRSWIALLYGAGRALDDTDPTLGWLIEEARLRDTADLPSIPPRWAAGAPPSRVEPGVLFLRGRLADELVVALADEADVLPTGYALLVVFGHHALTRVARCPRYDLYRSRHGVAVHDRGHDRWSWAYLWTGIDKLRHTGIGAVRCGATPDRIRVQARLDVRWASLSIEPETGAIAVTSP